MTEPDEGKIKDDDTAVSCIPKISVDPSEISQVASIPMEPNTNNRNHQNYPKHRH